MMASVTFRIALRALRRNKGRALLTALGIIIGIAAVIAVIAVGQGASSMMKAQISSMGSNLVMVFPGSTQAGGFRGGSGSRENLTVEDGEAIARECAAVKAVSPVVFSSAQAQYREKDWATSIQGVAGNYAWIRNWEIEEGEFLSESDVRRGLRVCVLGRTVARELFQDESAAGQYIRVRGILFKVLGVLAAKGSAAWGRDQDDIIVIPWTTSQRVMQRSTLTRVHQLLVSLESMEELAFAREEIRGILRQRHRTKDDAEDDFTVMDMTEISQMITQVSRLMTLLLTVIASISLVVGGIGIMNIMLVSVTERTREIGLRMAVGARRNDILWQFLVEAIVLAGLGGLLGIGLGVVVARIVGTAYRWPVMITPGSVALALSFAAGVGIFFGFYPAWRAARLNPIESLRHE